MDGSGKGKRCLLPTLIFTLLLLCVHAEKQKRQIFREQVLPALGGKIPEEAFRTDRLALNRLNKEGISIPDGVVLDARHVHKHPHTGQKMPKVLKVLLTPDGRYVPSEGRIHYDHPKAVDTTYIIRTPFGHQQHHHQNAKPLSNFANQKYRGGYTKQQTYTNNRQFLPLIPPTKPGIYKPIITPLILPAEGDLLQQPYLPSWNLAYDWDTIYQPLDDYFVNNIALFDSHQVLTDYQGFIDQFHGRSLRHVERTSHVNDPTYGSVTGDGRYEAAKVSQEASAQSAFNRGKKYYNNNNVASSDHRNFGYTNLTEIPETAFSCDGRRGLFADVETKCQVFHSCADWSRSSSLCPAGTAFSKEKNRCEWWNTVDCRE